MPQLSQLINHFEQSCLDVIAPWAVVLRPSVMKFSSLPEAPDAIAEISLRLSERSVPTRNYRMPASPSSGGEVLANRGDVYGSSVNLAAPGLPR